MSSRGNMFSTTLSVLKTDTETKRPVYEVNYCIAMSICDKCPDDGSCDDCLPVHTFSGLGGQNVLETFANGLLIILSMKGQHSLHTTVVIMMPILYCLI